MKMHTSDGISAQVQGLQSKSFGLQLNAKVYDMLISKLYQNKAGAVIRELFANAWDSHVEAGNTDMPIEIHMPSWLDQNFGIRDYGTGIPHDRFEDIYTNVGSSTKEHTNELIGGYGIGSKAAFTLTDTFLVENWRDNRKTTWLCFKSNGTPEVSKVGDEPSNEPSGLQCSFSFDSKSTVDSFVRELPKQLMFFPVKPLVTGGSTGDVAWTKLPKYEPTDTYFFMGDENGSRYNVQHYVVMGNVGYPFTSEDLSLDYSSPLRPLFESGKSLVLKAPLGSVDIPPSRENLELTEKTKAYLITHCNKVMQEYADVFTGAMGIQDNLLAAKKYVSNANTSIVDGYMRKHMNELTFGDGTTSTWYEVKKNWFSDKEYTVQSIILHFKNVLRVEELRVSHILQDNYVWYINDLQIGGVGHVNDQKSKLKTAGKVTLCVKPQKSYAKTTFAQDVIDCKAYIEKTYGVTAELLSSIIGFPPQSAKVAAGVKVEADQIFKAVYNYNISDSIRKFTAEYTDTTFPVTGYYLELKGWQIMGEQLDDVKRKINVLKGKTLEPVYLVRSKSIKKLGKNVRPFSELLESLKPKLLDQIEQNSYINMVSTTLGGANKVRGKIAKLDFPACKEYTLLKRYLRKLDALPTNLGNALRDYATVHGITYAANVSTSTSRTLPAKLAVLSAWFAENAEDAINLVEGSYWHKDKGTGYAQLNALIKGSK